MRQTIMNIRNTVSEPTSPALGGILSLYGVNNARCILGVSFVFGRCITGTGPLERPVEAYSDPNQTALSIPLISTRT